MGSDTVVGADEGSECRGCLAELEGDLDLFAHAETEATVFLRYGHSEQTQSAHLGDDLPRDGVFAGHLIFQRHQAIIDETRHTLHQLCQGFLINRHGRSSLDIPLQQPIMSPAGLPRRRIDSILSAGTIATDP